MNQEAQIDYLMSTADVGQARAIPGGTHPIMVGSDHRPVGGEVRCRGEEMVKGGWKDIARGWEPTNEEEKEKFQEGVTERMVREGNIHNAHEIIYEEATKIKYSTMGGRWNEEEKKLKEGNGIAELKRELRRTVKRTKERRDIKRRLDKAKRQDAGKKRDVFLRMAVEGRKAKVKDPIVMTINGIRTPDKEVWVQGAEVWGREKYGDSENTEEDQRRRVRELASAAADKLDGLQTKDPDFADFAEAVSSTEKNKAAGKDKVQAEMVKGMGIVAHAKMHEGHLAYMADVGNEDGVESWKEVPIANVPKERGLKRWTISGK